MFRWLGDGITLKIYNTMAMERLSNIVLYYGSALMVLVGFNTPIICVNTTSLGGTNEEQFFEYVGPLEPLRGDTNIK